MFEGYGQTECTAGATLTLPGDFGPGHVGPPLSCNIVKLEDVPDMNYFAANGEGEVSGIHSNLAPRPPTQTSSCSRGEKSGCEIKSGCEVRYSVACLEQKTDHSSSASGVLQGTQRVPGVSEGRPED